MKQLSTTFGKIRLTEIEGVEYGSVYDALKFLGLSSSAIRTFWHRLGNNNVEVVTKCNNFKFKGRGQKKTPVADLKTLLQICGKTREGYKIDNEAYGVLADLLQAPEKLVQRVEKIHGAKGIAKVKREADYLDSIHSLNDELNAKTPNDRTATGMMIGSVHKHNNAITGLPSKRGRDQMTKEQQSKLTAIQIIEQLKLAHEAATGWNAVNLCKQTANSVIKLIGN